MAITKVEHCLQDGTVLASKTTAPFSPFSSTRLASVLGVGTHTLIAKVYEDGSSTPSHVSDPVEITVSSETSDYLLDNFSGALYAHSYKRISSAYSGNAIDIRRFSDDLETNIAFLNDELNEQAIIDHSDSSTCYIKQTYDQTGNGRHGVQLTNAKQPLIYYQDSIRKVGGDNSAYQIFDDSLIETPVPILSNALSVKVISTTHPNLITGSISTNSKYFGRAFPGVTDGILDTGLGTLSYRVNGAEFTGTEPDDLYTALSGGTKKLLITSGITNGSEGTAFSGYAGGPYGPENVLLDMMFPDSSAINIPDLEAAINAIYNIY